MGIGVRATIGEAILPESLLREVSQQVARKTRFGFAENGRIGGRKHASAAGP
jgi:hypothetical protein